MLPELKYNQKVYIEITNLEHGGTGWEFGTCLWSPVYSKSKHKTKAWKIVEAIQPDDLIVHLVDIKGSSCLS